MKVGLELFLSEGPPLVRRLREENLDIFLDLKLHDIPNTVARAIQAVLPLQPGMLTVHASGGPAMLRTAQHAVTGAPTRLLAVTVLTSMDGEQLAATGVDIPTALQVERLAGLAQASGIPGLVSSAHEVARLRQLHPEAHLVTPGIRPLNTTAHDQHRVSTPAQALRDGADQLVIGRPITEAADPRATYHSVLEEMAAEISH